MIENQTQVVRYIKLYNEHFFSGTVIIDRHEYCCYEDGKTQWIKTNAKPEEKVEYILQEDIVFGPNSMKTTALTFLDSGIPLPKQFVSNGGHYSDMAFGIGFFAALVIKGGDYTVNLNEFTMSQSYEHYLRQRFFSLIELADSPFIPNVGPHLFATSISCARDVIIHNGTLGLSAHHGIHGNNVVNVHMHDLVIRDYEVAAIALNGSKDCLIEKVNIPQSLHEIPVLGIWSSGLFIFPYLRELYQKMPFFNLKIQTRYVYAKDLYKSFMQTFHLVANEILTKKKTKHPLFRNEGVLPIGTVYGIVLHETGVAVHGFPKKNRGTSSGHVIRDCVISNIKANILEIPTLSSTIQSLHKREQNNVYITPGIKSDVVGSVLQTQKQSVETIDDHGVYVGNIVANAQIMIAKAIYKKVTFRRSVTKNNIDFQTVEWVENGTRVQDEGMSYVFQGDVMHHVMKGLVGLKIDGQTNVIVENVTISNIHNETKHNGYFIDDMDGFNYVDLNDCLQESHDKYQRGIIPSMASASYAKNQMAVTRGISMSAAKNVKLTNIQITNLTSNVGEVIKIDKHPLLS